MLVCLLVIVFLIGLATQSHAADPPSNYLVLKGGIYSPSLSHDIENFNGGHTSHLDSKTGFAGEVAVGHYFLPFLAVELGGGYFESKGSDAAEPGSTKLKVVPVAWPPVKLPNPVALFSAAALPPAGWTRLAVVTNPSSLTCWPPKEGSTQMYFPSAPT